MTTPSAFGGAVTPTQVPPRDPPDELPTSDTGYRRLGLFILLAALGGFVAWASMTSLAVAVVAPGNVSMASFTRTVQHLEGGIVQRILVEDGDRVEAGDPLIVLSDTQARSQLDIVRDLYLVNRAKEVRLLAEQAGADDLEFPSELSDSDHPGADQALALQARLFVARREALRGALDSLEEQVREMRQRSADLEVQVGLDGRRLGSLREEAEDHRTLFREGLGDNQRLRELDRQVLELEGRIAQHRAEIASLASRVSDNRLQMALRRQEYQSQVGEQLGEAQGEVAEARERIIALGDQVERATLVAPVSGTVVGSRVRTRGAVIRPGDDILDIVPADGGFVVEARVPNRDIDNIYHGQPVSIRFSAFNQRLTNDIDGEVIHVSADSFEDEATGARYYKVRVRVTERGQRDMTETMQLLSGMPAEVMIRTGERSFASYIAKPITDMLARAIREE
jgi:membrane fusion protein, epimerase transport system